MPIQFEDLDSEIQEDIQPHLRPYFNQVTFETRTQWVMEYEMNDYEGFSSFDTTNYMDEKQFEAVKLDLFYHGENLYSVSKYGSISLVSKRPYTHPLQWSDGEIINLRNSNDFDDMRIHAEIRKILQSHQQIELRENDFIGYRYGIAMLVQPIESIDLSLVDDCITDVERIILHFHGPNDLSLHQIDNTIEYIKSAIPTTIDPLIGVAWNPELFVTSVSIFLYYSLKETNKHV